MPDIKENFGRIRLLCLFILLLLAVPGFAQQSTFQRERATPFYQSFLLQVESSSARLQPDASFTSLAIRLETIELYEQIYAIVGEDTLLFRPAAHQPEGGAGIVSELLVLDAPRQAIELHGLSEKTKITIHFMYAPPLKMEPSSGARKELLQSCEEPVIVQQSVWRDGLPEPDYTRSFNEVKHLIVHHSATSNSATDYTQVVRNIYLYHTQTNGWSDIGYNYLIAPNGVLYAGRDPGLAGAQDKVRGAHFCGKNSETMGVCLLGNFMETTPTALALEKLEKLLSWEAYKEKLNPLGVGDHPANPALPVIAGHRNGCATACPGDYLYALLPAVRNEVQAEVQACTASEGDVAYVYTNSQADEVCVENITGEEVERMQLFSLQGKQLATQAYRKQGTGLCWPTASLAPGIYIILFEGKDQQIRRKVLLL